MKKNSSHFPPSSSSSSSSSPPSSSSGIRSDPQNTQNPIRKRPMSFFSNRGEEEGDTRDGNDSHGNLFYPDEFIPICALDGCNKKVFVENDGNMYDFCGRTHARVAKERSSIKPSSSSASPKREEKRPKIAPPVPVDPELVIRRLYFNVTKLLSGFCSAENELGDMHLYLSPFILAQYLADKIVDEDSPEHCLEVHYLNLISVLKERTQVHAYYKTDYDDSLDIISMELGTKYPSTNPITFRELLEDFHQDEYICGIPGCTKFANISGYCSKPHFQKGNNAGYLPSLSIGTELALVSRKDDWSAHLLTTNHPWYLTIKQQFHTSWEHKEYDKPVIQRIYKLRTASHIFYRFKDKESELNSHSLIQFHGTFHDENCRFGIIPTGRPCDNPNCSVCSICTSSFALSRAETNGGKRLRLRYGPGLYFSPISSKSHDYTNTRSHHDGFKMRSIFLCKVIPGRRFVTKEGFMEAKDCPPIGYHSIHGIPGKELNYEELVVYDEAQAIPTHVIFYTTRS